MATAKDSKPEYMVAKTSVYLGEEIGTIKAGTLVRADDPLVAKYPDLFGSVEDRLRVR